MLHTKSLDYRTLGSRYEDFKRVLTYYGHTSHLGNVAKTIFISPLFPGGSI